MKFLFKQVDVFSNKSCLGNPVCVFIESDGLETGDMLKIARWTNLSETTFVTKVDKTNYSVRIFTPNEELPFAGHPTLGTAWALYESGIISENQFLQKCEFGLINITRDDDKIHFELPFFEILSSMQDREISKVLSIPCNGCMLINTGPHWIVGRVDDLVVLDDIQIDKEYFKMIAKKHKIFSPGITVYAIEDYHRIHTRTFFDAGKDIIEDPVCGSGNAAVAVHIKEQGIHGKVSSKYSSFQGKHLYRQGEVSVEIGDRIKVGGYCNTVLSGQAEYSK